MVGAESLAELVLVTVAPFQQTHRRERAQHPGQLRDLGHVRLAEKRGLFRVEPAGQKIQRHLEGVFSPLFRVEERSHRVVIGDEIVGFPALLPFDGRLHHAEIIAQMQSAGRLDA